MQRLVAAATVSLVLSCPVAAQSLYERPVAPAPVPRSPTNGGAAPATQPPSAGTDGTTPNAPMSPDANPGTPQAQYAAPMRTPRAQPIPSLADISLFAIAAPEDREFVENDLITIIISERSKTERNQKLDSKKDYNIDAKVSAWIDLMQLMEARVVPDGKTGSQLPGVGVDFQSDFKGDGKYTREDKLTDRIQARVVEVKPNGTLLIEARRSVVTDLETQEVVLSGMCRSEDVTEANSIQSNQLYDLMLNVQNKGDVKKTNEKGLIPRVLDGLFNF